MTNFLGAAALAFVFIGIVPQFAAGAGWRMDFWLPGIILFAVLWCALTLRNIELHLRAEGKRQAMTFNDTTKP
jgi:fatty acid desaturase